MDDGYGYGQQPSSARASVASPEGFGPNSSRTTRDDAFGGGRPVWPLSVCLGYMAVCLLGLSVCLSAYLCLSASLTACLSVCLFACLLACLSAGVIVCLPVRLSVTTQTVSEICIQRLVCSSFGYHTDKTVFT